MRSFQNAVAQYAVQWNHNKTIENRVSTLMPACKLRLLNVTSGGPVVDPLVDTQQQSVGFTVRDGIFHMDRLREALNALDRCGWKRSYHQRM
jgi:hypothetical protein